MNTRDGGELGIRTLGEFPHTAFRVLHLRPLGQLSLYGATSRTRTDGLRITNALLYQLSHSSMYPNIIMDVQYFFKCFFNFILQKGASLRLLLLFLNLSVVDKLCKLYGVNNLAVLINTHIARSNFIDKDNFVVVVTELKLDIPEVKTD